MNFIVVGYYTENTFYENYARRFIESMEKFSIPYYVEAIKDLGNWYKNTCYKPTFLLEMMKKFPDDNIVYVDCDAKFFRHPDLFLELDCNIAVHYFDRRNHPKIVKEEYEVLSGTIFLKNISAVYELVERWEKECQRKPRVWDQKSLEKILDGDFYHLPPEYCTIVNLMRWVSDPVIVHYQASREIRKGRGKIPKKLALESCPVPFPKEVL